MRRDWIWGWVSGVPALFIAVIWIKSAGLFAGTPWIAIGLACAFAIVVSTSVLWLANQRSIRKIRRSGGAVELIIRPRDAIMKAVVIFLAIFGLNVLLRLLFTGPAIDWGRVIFTSAAMSFGMSLVSTAYKKPG